MGLAVLMLPVLLVSVDNTVLAFAVPEIAQVLQPSGAQQLWMIDIYPLVLSALLIAMGSMADRFGRKLMLLLGSTGFAAVSAIAAFSPSAETLIITRAGMGLFGAMLMPASLSLIRNMFHVPSERRLAIAIWASGFSAGAALGPLVSGVLLNSFWWGSVFLIAVPVTVPLLIFGPMLLTESKDPNPAPIDVVSIVLSMLGFSPLIFGIKALAKDGVGGVVVVCFGVSILALWLFGLRQLRRTQPMLDIRLFRNRAFSGSVTINLLSVVAIMGFMFFVTQHLQLILELKPLAAAMVILPGFLVTIMAGLSVVPLVKRFRPHRLVALGMALAGAGYLVTAIFALNASVWDLLIAFAFLGAGIGIAETLSNDIILSSVPPQQAGAASAISETSYEVGAVLGTAVMGGILTGHYFRTIEIPAGLSAADAAAARETLGGAVAVAEGLPDDLAGALMDAAAYAFDSGVVVTSVVGVVLMAITVVIALRALRGVRM